MVHNQSRVPRIGAMVSVGLIVLACRHTRTFNYTTQDPDAEALCAFTDSGDYRVLAIKSGDSLIIPIDSSVAHGEINLEKPPGGFYIFLKPEGLRGHPDRPSEVQDSFMTRYNSVIWTLLQSLRPGSESLPPNLRMKLSWCGGRQKEKGPS